MVVLVVDAAVLDSGLWVRILPLFLMAVGSFFLNKEHHFFSHGKSGAEIGFLDSMAVFPECKKAFWKMLFGVILLMSAVLIIYLASQNEEYLLLGTILALLLMVVGAFKSAAYAKCLAEYNQRQSTNTHNKPFHFDAAKPRD